MRQILALVIAFVIIVVATGCKKNTTAPGADSIELHREGGIAGFSDHYLLTDKRVMKASAPQAGNAYNFNIVLPKAKYEQVKSLRTTIPGKFFTDYPQGIQFHEYRGDLMLVWVVVTRGGKTYTWDLSNLDAAEVPAYALPYTQQVQDAINLLHQ